MLRSQDAQAAVALVGSKRKPAAGDGRGGLGSVVPPQGEKRGDQIRNSPWVRKFLNAERPAEHNCTTRGPFRVARPRLGGRPASGPVTQWKTLRSNWYPKRPGPK
jgi:hypothetical protein